MFHLFSLIVAFLVALCLVEGSKFHKSLRGSDRKYEKKDLGRGTHNCYDSNPCTEENLEHHLYYHTHDDPNFFIQCSEFGECFVMPCAPGTVWNQLALTCTRGGGGGGSSDDSDIYDEYDCDANNPCTPENIAAGNFYHAHHNPSMFVQCSEWGECFVMPCAPGTVWNQDALTCTRGNDGDDSSDSDSSDSDGDDDDDDIYRPYNCNDRNPCTPENIAEGHFYHSHPDPAMFVQCSEFGECFEMPCAPGTKWNPVFLTCTWDVATHHANSCDGHNPCTAENIAAGHFYFPHSDPTMFIQCSEFGDCYEMPCRPGTEWNEDILACTRA